MNVEPYDFRKPGKLAQEQERGLGAWLRLACELASERLAKEVRAEWSLQGVEVVHAGSAVAGLGAEWITYRVALGHAETKTYLAFPRPLVLALVAGLLGDPVAELPADRDASAVEDALFEYLVQCLLLPILPEAWPEGQAPKVVFQQREPDPRHARTFAPNGHLVLCRLSARGSFGAQEWHWLVPQEIVVELFAPRQDPAQPAAPAQQARPRVEAFVRELPVEVAVRLGNVELPLSMLADLRVRDVLVLDQRVSEPLKALVAGEERLRVWPGRVGLQQAVQIESLVES